MTADFNTFPNGAGGPSTANKSSRFIGDFGDGNNSFQNGVDQNIWANSRKSTAFNSKTEVQMGANSHDLPLENESQHGRPGSSSSRLAGGPIGLGQSMNGDTSPIRQRNRQAPRPFANPSKSSSNLAVSAPFTNRQPLDASVGLFSQSIPVDSFQAQVHSSSRASSRHRMGSSGLDNGISSFWDSGLNDHSGFSQSRTNSQAVSRSNSQAVSRNNSLPPSRHGMESSPTDASFNLGSFQDLRTGSIASERPPSSGHVAGISFGQFTSNAARRPSITMSSSPGDQILGIDSAPGDAFSLRSDSVGPRSINSAASTRGMDPMQAAALQDKLRDMSIGSSFAGIQPNPTQHLSMTLDAESGFPMLNEIQRGQANVGSLRTSRDYVGQMRQDRSYGQNFHAQAQAPAAQSQFQYPANWQYQNHMAATQNGFSRNTGSYGISSHLQPEPFDLHQPQSFSRPTGGRHNAQLFASSQNMRGPVGGRAGNAYTPSTVSTDPLLSGTHWTERTRPNNGQKYIETTSDCRLRDVLGFVARFCGDQAGSRFLQDKLEVANTDEKETVFQELLPNTIPLCTDPFGNYVIQKFFEHGTQRQKEQLAEKMRGKVRDLSTNMYGCRCIQKAFEHILVEQQATLVQELKPCLYEISQDQHGNHVVQKAIERLPPNDIQFIIHGYYGHVLEMSNNAYGCRVVQRLLEFDDVNTRAQLIDEIHRCATSLVRNPYGNYVVQHIIDHGSNRDRDRLISAIQPIIVELISNKYASNVVEKCLAFGTEQQRDSLVEKISEVDPATHKPRYLKNAMLSNFGNYVVQRILNTLPSGPWEPFAHLVDGQLNEIVAERGADKKTTEFQKILQRGPRNPNDPDQCMEKPKKEGRQSRSSTTASSQPPKTIKRAPTASTDESSGDTSGTTPPLTRAQPSPQSSNAPSTSDNEVPTGVSPNTKSVVALGSTTDPDVLLQAA